MSTEQNKTITSMFMEDIWSEGKLEIADQILAPDFVFRLGVPPYEVHGIEDFKALVVRNRQSFRDLTYEPEVERAVAEDNRVVLPWRMHAYHQAPWAGLSASNKNVAIKGMTHFTFAEGRILEAEVQNEGLSLVRQVGGIAPVGVKAPEYKHTQASEAIVRRYVEELIIKRNFAIAGELVGPGFKVERSALPEALIGAEGLREQLARLGAAFPDLEPRIADLFASGDKVAVRFEAPGTHLGEFAGIAPTGRRVTWKGVVLYRVADGKVAEAFACWDDVGLLQSLR
jgi:steroid delta-isomerase-like uncharacterized protein